MNSKELIMELANKTGWTSKEVTDMLSAFGSAVGTKLMEGDSIYLDSLGEFEAYKDIEHIEIDKDKGKRYLLPPKILPIFKLDDTVKKCIKELDNNE